MNEYFRHRFSREANEIIEDDYYFNSDQDGDCFDELDRKLWLDGERFKNNWFDKQYNRDKVFQFFYDDIYNILLTKTPTFIEIACGPGMGIAPIILSQCPKASCLISDANSMLIKSWRKYIHKNLGQYDINLASFSTLNIPIISNSIDIVTSFIGISSSRSGLDGKIRSVQEVYRILNDGGYFIAIESEWTNHESIYEVFHKWGISVWEDMKERVSWNEIFTDAGFIIESCDKTYYKNLTKDDNELGEQANKYGINIEQKLTLFILRK